MSLFGDGTFTEINPAYYEPIEGAKDGDGGETLSLWQQSRQNLIASIAGSADFTNLSEFSIPSALFSRTGDSWTTDWVDGEYREGIRLGGVFLDPEGQPLSGTLTIGQGDTVLSSSQVAGQVDETSPPPSTVISGESFDSSRGIEGVFRPDIVGLSTNIDNFGINGTFGTVQYGEVTGQVQNYDGDPLEGETVRGTGFGAVTDENGEFVALAPSGQTVTLVGLEGTYSFDASIPTSGSTTINVRYPKIEVEVLDADYEPVENAPVDINAERKYTDERGVVEINKAPIGLYDITIMSAFSVEDFEVAKEGQLYEIRAAPGEKFGSSGSLDVGSLDIDIFDKDNGKAISDVEAILLGEDKISLTNDEGTVTLLSDNVGSSEIVAVAPNDSRYEQEVIEVDVPQQGSGYDQVALSRGSDSSTY